MPSESASHPVSEGASDPLKCPDTPHALIGAGGQFTVYDIGDGRVLKLPNSPSEAYRAITEWESDSEVATKLAAMTAHFREESVPHVLRLAARYPELSAALAHPLPVSDAAFTQNKVRLLAELIASSSPDEIRRYLDDFADLILLCWRYGVYDRLFNFGENNGLDANGRVVLIDFGETSFDTTFVTDMVVSHVQSRYWEIHLERHLLPSLHDHYRQLMHSQLTTTNFELLWGSTLGEIDKVVISRPALCERKDDLPKLTEQLLERASHEAQKTVGGVSPEVMSLFYEYHWPGSVCELDNTLHRAVVKCGSDVIQVEDIQMSPLLKWILGRLYK